MRRIVVEQRESGDAGSDSNIGHVVCRAMTPSEFRPVFLARILRVMNQKVGATQEFNMTLVSGMMKIGPGRIPEGFVIGHVGDGRSIR